MNAISDSNPVPPIRDAVNEVRERIDSHEAYLRNGSGAEMRTRLLLIDPVLSRLGWKVVDPVRVQIELQVAAGIADYVLQTDGKPSAIVEAKAFREPLKAHELQLFAYMSDDALRVQVGVLTDGREWRFYRNSGRLTLEERVTVTQGEAYEVADKLNRRIARSIFEPSSPITRDCTPLASVSRIPEGKEKLKEIIIGTEPGVPVRTWKGLLVGIATHLVLSRRIQDSDLPVKVTERGNCLINDVGRHPNGTDFRSGEQIREGVVLETFGNRKMLIKNAIWLLEEFDDGPSSVQVCFD